MATFVIVTVLVTKYLNKYVTGDSISIFFL